MPNILKIEQDSSVDSEKKKDEHSFNTTSETVLSFITKSGYLKYEPPPITFFGNLLPRFLKLGSN